MAGFRVRRRGSNNISQRAMKVVTQVMKDTGTKIEMSLGSKDQSLTFLIKGKHDSALKAKRELLNNVDKKE